MVSSTDVYKAVLAELKHYNTTSMTPAEFNYHIWIAELEYVKNRYWAHEQHQKQIDDLAVIKVVTDGVAGYPMPLPNEGPNMPGMEYVTLLQDHLYLLAVAVQVKYKDVPCQVDGQLSPFTAATHLKDDERFVVSEDYYMKPIAEYPNLYYDQRGKRLTFNCGNSTVQNVMLSYLRLPARITFDETGAAHVGSEFEWPQTLEIVKHCVISYLETVKDPRVQSMIGVTDRTFQQSPPPNVPT
jgi:hypothetical protein